MYRYDKYTTAAATWPGRYWMHTVVSRLSLTKLVAACEENKPHHASKEPQHGGHGRGVRDRGVGRGA